jgi:hypothetical protein
MQHPRSSQPQSLHHHTSEHSNFSAIIVCSFRHSLGQTTHCQKTRTKFQRRSRIFFTQYAHPDAPKPIHPDKEQICSRQLSWEQTSNSQQPDLFRNRFLKNRNSNFPVNTPAKLTPIIHGGDGRNRTDDPLLAKQVLYQLSYIPN